MSDARTARGLTVSWHKAVAFLEIGSMGAAAVACLQVLQVATVVVGSLPVSCTCAAVLGKMDNLSQPSYLQLWDAHWQSAPYTIQLAVEVAHTSVASNDLQVSPVAGSCPYVAFASCCALSVIMLQ